MDGTIPWARILDWIKEEKGKAGGNHALSSVLRDYGYHVASHLSQALSHEKLHLRPWVSQWILRLYLSSILSWLREVRLTWKPLVQQEQRLWLFGLFLSRQLTYYTDKTLGKPWRWIHGTSRLMIMGVTSDAPFANREWGGSAEKTVALPFAACVFAGFPGKAPNRIRKDGEEGRRQMLPNCLLHPTSRHWICFLPTVQPGVFKFRGISVKC